MNDAIPRPQAKTPKALTPLLEIRNLTKSFDGQHAVDDVNLTIYKGEIFALLGASGCGKSTLLRMLAGFEEPTAGQIMLDGVDLSRVPPYQRPINMMFQSYALFPHMTVEQNIAFGLKQDKLPKAEITARVAEMLSLVHMQEFAKRKPHQLSGGQRQRVAFARALAPNPQVLLLDEPMAALDRKLRKEMQSELKRLQHELGIAFLCVTHDQEEALTMSDRIVIMDKGEIQQDDDPNTIYHYPKTKFVAGFIGESNFFDNGKEILVLRPEKLNLCGGKDCDDSHPAPRFFGTVEDVIFYGTIDKVFIRLDGTGQEVLAYQYFDDVHRWQINDHVGIWWYEKDEVRVER